MSSLFEYSPNFFINQQTGSYNAAKKILPAVFEIFHPNKIIDVGCGTGAWLKICKSLGAGEVLGIDGHYVNEDILQISKKEFQIVDLNKEFIRFKTNNIYDLAISLEVAEHLDSKNAESFIAGLTRLSPVILFSAAIPYQGGTNHKNEQWQDYWADIFLSHDFLAFDVIRNMVWSDPDVQIWYKQNAILYINKEHYQTNYKSAHLEKFMVSNHDILRQVHPEMYLSIVDPQRITLERFIQILKSIPYILRKILKKYFKL